MSAPKLEKLHWFRIMLAVTRRQIVNRIRRPVQGSKLMTTVILGFIFGYWIFFTRFFWEGIRFIMGIPALGELLLNRMFYILFAFLMVMLAFSCLIVGYSTFFKNRETQWHLTLPVPYQDVFRWKFAETTLLASWAFLFLSGPLLLAYAIYLKLSIWFLVGVSLIYFPFALLCAVIGTWFLLAFVKIMHNRVTRTLFYISAGVLLILAYVFFKPVNVEHLQELQLTPLMNMLLENSQAAAQPFLPSYWLSACILSLSSQLWAKLIFFVLVILSHCLLGIWSILFLTAGIFYDNTSLVQDRILHGAALKARTQVRWATRTAKWFVSMIPGLRPGIRALIVKDWAVFWRDPAQWSQFAIFFGLLGFYFLNLRSLHQPNMDDRFWISVIAFLNLTSLALILATLTTRFIYPQFSLEGRHFWLINMAPVTLRQVMFGKFWASALASGALTVALMLISFQSLKLELFMRILIGYTIILLSIGLSSLAISLGVLFPNLKQDNPARIVSGFGGTLCLVVSLGYIVLVVLLEAIPIHIFYVHRPEMNFRFASVLAMVYIVVTAVNALVTAIPLSLAARKLKTLEI